jgi:hypothetical protein
MHRFPSFHRNSSTTGVLTAREQLSEILSRHYTAAVAQESRRRSEGDAEGRSSREPRREKRMPSSKGNPTDPELREQVKEEVKAEEKGMVHLMSSLSLLSLVVLKKVTCLHHAFHLCAMSLPSCLYFPVDIALSRRILPSLKQKRGPK